MLSRLMILKLAIMRLILLPEHLSALRLSSGPAQSPSDAKDEMLPNDLAQSGIPTEIEVKMQGMSHYSPIGYLRKPEPGYPEYFDFHIPKTGAVSFAHDLFYQGVLPKGHGYWSNEVCLKDAPSGNHVAFFRNPRAHVYSQYLECKYDVWGKAMVGNQMDKLDTFTTWLNHFNGGNVTSDMNCYHPYNMQTRALTCEKTSHHHTSEPSFDDAMVNLKSLFFFGILEHYQASVCLFGALATNMESLNPFCVCKDKSKWDSFNSNHDTHNVPAHSLSDLSAEDNRLVDELTKMDADLYTYAVEHFKAEVAKVEKAFNTSLLC